METIEFQEALKKMVDGLNPGEWKQVYRNNLGMSMYVTPCVDCRAPVKNWTKNRKQAFRCAHCKAMLKEKEKHLSSQITSLQKQRWLEKAIKIIEKQTGNISEYGHAIETVQKHFDKSGWFQSTNEILAALELIRTKTKARHQVVMGRWRADFVLPDMKVVLEVDGAFHSQKIQNDRDKLKDAAIIAALGPGWEIVRIDDELFKSNIKRLVPAIEAVIRGRRGVRSTHHGQLPANYSASK